MTTRTCNVCATEQDMHPRCVVCTPCRKNLRLLNLVWCVTCNSIGESWTKTNREHARCRVCHRQKSIHNERAYRARQKAEGRTRKKSPSRIIHSQTPKERDRISALLDAGKSIEQVVRIANVSRSRVRSTISLGAAQAAGSKRHQGTMTPVLTSPQLKQIFQHMNTSRLGTWRKNGFPMIPYGNAKQQNAKVQLYYIPEESLEAWMRNRTSWMLWSVDDVVDPFWKSIAIEIRESVSGRWVTVNEAANILGLQPCGLKRRIREGDYTGQWCRSHHKFWLWSEDIVDHAWTYDGRRVKI